LKAISIDGGIVFEIQLPGEQLHGRIEAE